MPDFLWIAVDSATISPVLIEIERPEKKWFTSKGQATAELSQAQHQLMEWKRWMAEPAHQMFFRDFYDINDEYWRRLAFQPQYILIYGRRNEFDRDDFNKQRRLLEHDDEHYMTLDRLAPDYNARELLCLSISQQREFRVVTWPPVATVGPGLASDREKLHGLSDAIHRCKGITEQRRRFLSKRIGYWNTWAREFSSRRGFIRAGDSE